MGWCVATVYKGQVFAGYIAQIPGVDEPIRWKFRGMWPALRAKYAKELEACTTPEEQESLIIATMARMIIEWNLKYPDTHPDEKKRGQHVPVDAEVIRDDLMTHVRNRIMAISTWQQFSDVDPQQAIAEHEKAIQAKANGKSAAELFEEIDGHLVKN